MLTAKSPPKHVLYLDCEQVEAKAFKLRWCLPQQESGGDVITGTVLEFKEEGSDWVMWQETIQGTFFTFKGNVCKSITSQFKC